MTDHHEMGTNSTFFFQPGVPDRVNPMIPINNQKLTEKIAGFHAEYLDKIGSLYYSKENYDDFYFGKGSTYPDINGSIGILFEQGSSRGHVQESQNGILTFPFTIKNQLTTIFSTLKAASSIRVDLLKHMNNFYLESINESKNSKIKGIGFGNSSDKSSSYELAKILRTHKIKVNETVDGDYKYYVSLNQPKSKLIKAMFETTKKFKDSLFYDVSAWTFPLAFNLNYGFLKKDLNIIESDIKKPVGKVSSLSNYGYLIEPHDYNIPTLINKLFINNIRVKSSSKKIFIKNKIYDYGSLFIPVVGQSKSSNEIHNLLVEISKETGIDNKGQNSG